MMPDCLIIDDDASIAATISEYFSLFDLTCEYATSFESGLKTAIENPPSLIILDINLGEESGFALCKKLRETSDVPIIFISARNTDDDILVALGIGGDDYVAKPFAMSVLLARAKAVLKRSATMPIQPQREIIKFGNIEIDKGNDRVTRNGETVKLKPLELKLLLYLIENKNNRVTKDALLEKVWGDTFIGEGTLSVHIRHLREKLEDIPNSPQFIKTVWGSGYMFEGAVE
ncbi:MAG: response regulator transcription factor [Defluviitaleaceae bacterium]|nr:response regulator transcription factor [Defluviitaleaceae bacterium]